MRRSDRRRLRAGLVLAAASVLLTGCIVSETRPQARIEATQASTQIPDEELLDVAVRVFDPGIPEQATPDEEALAKQRIYPELRKAEARFLAVALRNTLEASGQWGAVRTVPETVQFVDVVVSGRVLESTGKRLVLEISAQDSTGRQWLTKKRYEAEADLGSYKTDAALRARDPFQNLHSRIANDLLLARELLTAADRREVRRVAQLRFAQDLAPEAMSGYLAAPATSGPREQRGLVHVARLPADNDPLMERVDRVRERDAAVIDTLNGYYVGFAEQMQESYGSFRRTSYEEIDKEEAARASARTRTVLGAAAVAAAIFVPGSCNSQTTCNVQSAARYAGGAGGVGAILSGLKKYADARTHAQSFKELASTFQAEVSPQVVEVEGRSLKLSGTADEQYREWRSLLREFYEEESGAPASVGTGTAGASGAAGAEQVVAPLAH